MASEAGRWSQLAAAGDAGRRSYARMAVKRDRLHPSKLQGTRSPRTAQPYFQRYEDFRPADTAGPLVCLGRTVMRHAQRWQHSCTICILSSASSFCPLHTCPHRAGSRLLLGLGFSLPGSRLPPRQGLSRKSMSLPSCHNPRREIARIH